MVSVRSFLGKQASAVWAMHGSYMRVPTRASVSGMSIWKMQKVLTVLWLVSHRLGTATSQFSPFFLASRGNRNAPVMLHLLVRRRLKGDTAASGKHVPTAHLCKDWLGSV